MQTIFHPSSVVICNFHLMPRPLGMETVLDIWELIREFISPMMPFHLHDHRCWAIVQKLWSLFPHHVLSKLWDGVVEETVRTMS